MNYDVFDDIKYLYVSLPEDLQRLKDIGDFDKLKEVIDLRLETTKDEPLKRRLHLEKHIVDVYESAYTYPIKEAYQYASERLSNFTYEEFLSLMDKGSIDYIYKNKEVYVIKSFYDNIVKTLPELENRIIKKSSTGVEGEDINSKSDELDKLIAEVKEKGEVKIRYEAVTTLKIKKEHARIGEKIKVHLPVPNENHQISEVKILSNDHIKVSNKNNLSQTVYFEETLKEDAEFSVRYSFVNTSNYVNIDLEKGSDKSISDYTDENYPHIVFTPYLKNLYQSIAKDETNKLKIARKIYDYITTSINYSFLRPYKTYENIPEYMARNLKGDCGFYALLFITLCRIGGIPAVWQSGLYVSGDEANPHDWARFYVGPYGWLFADGSFGSSGYRKKLKERHDFYFGNLEPCRIVFNNDYYVEFDPPKKQYRHDPYDNQVGEAEYEDDNLEMSELEYSTKIIKKEILS